MSSDNLKPSIGRLNMITIGAALAFHLTYVMPCCFELRKDNKYGKLCASRTRQAIRRTLIWLAIWFLELCVGSIYYTHFDDRIRLYAMTLSGYIELFSALSSTVAFTPAILAQVELALALQYPQRDITPDNQDLGNGKPVRRICQHLTRTVEIMAILRLCLSFSALGSKYRVQLYLGTIFLDVCIPLLLLLSASMSFIYFLKARPFFKYSFPVSPMLPHLLSVLRHLIEAASTLEIKYKAVTNPKFRDKVYWEAVRVIFVGWSMVGCLLALYCFQVMRAGSIWQAPRKAWNRC